MSKTYNRPLQHDEYIRLKYLSGTVNEEQEKARKRKAIKAATKHKKIKIVDDDIDLKRLNCQFNEDDDEIYYGTKEEKPVIAAIIDERPMHLKRKDAKGKWITIAEGEDEDVKKPREISKPISSTVKMRDLNEVKLKNKELGKIEKDLSPPRLPQVTERVAQDDDLSPPRARASVTSPRRVKSSARSDEDLSPPRIQESISSTRREKRSRWNDDDISPPRIRASVSPTINEKGSRSDDDLSPPRAKAPDLSTVRDGRTRNRDDDDLSPPRHRTTRRERDSSPSRQKRTRNIEDDLSPPRIKSESSAIKGNRNKLDNDISPIRDARQTRERSPHSSRRHRSPKNRRSHSRDREKRNHHRSRRDDSNRSVSPRNSSHRHNHDNHYSSTSKHSTEKSSKKSDSTSNERDRQGLWDAKSVREEAKRAREKEKQAIAQVATEISGKNAKTVVRDRTTGKIRDLEAEAKIAAEKNEEEEKKLANYKDWNVGVKQREEQKARVEDTLHEFTKPLARYADDDDLDKLLREREQIDDPMLQYMRQKKAKEQIEKANERGEKILEKPKYNGPPAPLNRFNIQPGYRWDGVDRSNGFERSFFSRQAEKSAIREEAYRWSTEDM